MALFDVRKISMTCLTLKWDLYKRRPFFRQYLKNISVLSFQINLEDIATRLVEKHTFNINPNCNVLVSTNM